MVWSKLDLKWSTQRNLPWKHQDWCKMCPKFLKKSEQWALLLYTIQFWGLEGGTNRSATYYGKKCTSCTSNKPPKSYLLSRLKYPVLMDQGLGQLVECLKWNKVHYPLAPFTMTWWVKLTSSTLWSLWRLWRLRLSVIVLHSTSLKDQHILPIPMATVNWLKRS